jgi:hypothetical protein
MTADACNAYNGACTWSSGHCGVTALALPTVVYGAQGGDAALAAAATCAGASTAAACATAGDAIAVAPSLVANVSLLVARPAAANGTAADDTVSEVIDASANITHHMGRNGAGVPPAAALAHTVALALAALAAVFLV